MSNIYLIEVKTPYVTRLFKYWGSEAPTEEEVMYSHGEEAAGEVEAVNIYTLDELAELPVCRKGEMTGTAAPGVGLAAYTIYIDQVETKLLEADSEENAVGIFVKTLTAGELLSMLRISASAD